MCTFSQNEQILKQTNQIYDSLIRFRRDLHRHPELSGNEIRTSTKIKEYLDSLGLEVKIGIGGNGVVGILKGKHPGKVLAWRADIDAFETDFPDNVDFKSENEGVRHICGHDVHTAIGLGIANVLSKLKNEFNGTIMFIFQPSEENFEGAKKMLEAGIFDRVKPDAIFALHLAPISSDKISCKLKEMYWRGKVLSIEIEGKEDLEKVTDTLTNYLLQISTESENSPYFNINTLMSPANSLGNPNSIYKDYFVLSKSRIKKEINRKGMVLKAEVESSNQENFNTGIEKLKKLINNSEYKDRIANIGYTEHYPTVYNNPNLTQSSIKILTSNFGNEIFMPLYGVSPFNNDDFAYFQQEIDGVYFFLGASDFENGIISAPHAPNFMVDEESIRNGVNYFSTLIIEQLKELNKNAP